MQAQRRTFNKGGTSLWHSLSQHGHPSRSSVCTSLPSKVSPKTSLRFSTSETKLQTDAHCQVSEAVGRSHGRHDEWWLARFSRVLKPSSSNEARAVGIKATERHLSGLTKSMREGSSQTHLSNTSAHSGIKCIWSPSSSGCSNSASDGTLKSRP